MGPEKLPKLIGYRREESVEGGGGGKCHTRWKDTIRRDAEYAGVDQDPEVVAAERTQWRDVLALFVSWCQVFRMISFENLMMREEQA